MSLFVGPFEILDRISLVAYRLALPPNLSHIYDVFHVLVLMPYYSDVTHILDWHSLQVEDEQLSLESICILQHRGFTLKGQDIE